MTTDRPKDDSPTLPIIDNVSGPEIFASTVAAFSLGAGTVTLAFGSVRYDNNLQPAPPKVVIIARAVLTIPAAQALVADLNTFLESKGLGLVSPEEKARMQ